MALSLPVNLHRTYLRRLHPSIPISGILNLSTKTADFHTYLPYEPHGHIFYSACTTTVLIKTSSYTYSFLRALKVRFCHVGTLNEPLFVKRVLPTHSKDWFF